MNRVYTQKYGKLDLEDHQLGRGAAGKVHRIIFPSELSSYCVKIYKSEKQTVYQKKKIDLMIGNPPDNCDTKNYRICWPTHIITDYNSLFLGFVMPLAIQNSISLYEFKQPQFSKRIPTIWHKFNRTTEQGRLKRLKICVNIAIAIHSLHSKKYVLVDYKPENMLITESGQLSVVDVDSVQIVQNGKVLFHSEAFTEDYIPPEGYRMNPQKEFVPESWDRFSMAVVFYEILCGLHPYCATSYDDHSNQGDSSFTEAVKKGYFVHGKNRSKLKKIPNLHSIFSWYSIEIQKFFHKAFDEGNVNPTSRPSAEDWGQMLTPIITDLEKSLKTKKIHAPIYTYPPLSHKTHNSNLPDLSHLRKSPNLGAFGGLIIIGIIVIFTYLIATRTGNRETLPTAYNVPNTSQPLNSGRDTYKPSQNNYNTFVANATTNRSTIVYSTSNVLSRQLFNLTQGVGVRTLKNFTTNLSEDQYYLLKDINAKTDNGNVRVPARTVITVIGEIGSDFIIAFESSNKEMTAQISKTSVSNNKSLNWTFIETKNGDQGWILSEALE